MLTESEPDPESSERASVPPPSSGNLVAKRNGALRTPLARPILASETLLEEIAPLQPAKTLIRYWLAASSVFFLLSGILHSLGMLQPRRAWVYALVLGLVSLLLAGVPIPYKWRAGTSVALGVTVIVVGLFHQGLLSQIVSAHDSWVWEFFRMVAATALPAALLFRARYRAYRGARYALIVGLLLAFPTAIHESVDAFSGTILERISSATVMVSLLGSLLGFMGTGTTGASTLWAYAVAVSLGLDIAARALVPGTSMVDALMHGHAALVFILCCMLIAYGLFEFLAVIFAKDARRTDVLKVGRDSEHPLTD
jgi:hypothetical protein